MLRAAATLAMLLVACTADEEKNPPPIGGTAGGASVTAGAQGETGQADDDGGGSMGAGSGGVQQPDLGMDLLLSGRVLAGAPNIVTPLNCALRLFEPGGIDPATGNIVDVALQVPLTVQQLPHPYQVGINDAAGVIMPGQAVYATVTCDIDEDGLFDNLGGFYPQLPLELFQLPSTGIDVELFFQ